MKPLALLFLLAFAPLYAADLVQGNILITTDFLQVDAAVANELMHGNKPATSGKEWHSVLAGLLQDKTTTALASLSVTTKGGQRATVESVLEKIYATEFKPAEGRKEHSPAVPATFSGVDVPTPCAFEMKPVGARMEVDPVIAPDGTTIELTLAPELTVYLGDDAMVTLPGEGGDKPVITMPRYYDLKTQTSVAIADGGSALIAVLVPQKEDGTQDIAKRVLIFTTARLVKP